VCSSDLNTQVRAQEASDLFKVMSGVAGEISNLAENDLRPLLATINTAIGHFAVTMQTVGDLLDEVAKGFPQEEIEDPTDLKVAILGRPNVGKSSLLNILTGENTALVSEISGTTRDSVHTNIVWHGHKIRLIDTAGLRRKSKVTEAVDVFSNMRTIRALDQCDVAIFMVDATEGSVNQDAKIAGMIHDQGKGVVVVFNKWDLVKKDTNTHLEHWEKFCTDVPFVPYAPWFMASALTKQRTGRIMEKVWEVHEARQKRIPTSELNSIMERITTYQLPRAHAGGLGKIYYTTQVETAPPVFLMSLVA